MFDNKKRLEFLEAETKWIKYELERAKDSINTALSNLSGYVITEELSIITAPAFIMKSHRKLLKERLNFLNVEIEEVKKEIKKDELNEE